ncbi:matrixin family metalloprotease [Actinomadura sp. LD22]|uniref:Matrixin family metalloprotease n=1 Tax=Actinomadura physcomitrii TaxID=2650748 RepID=A0A6I4MXL7_9ACTN|nr:matrixin family metalloprotease [Actinomadura physcomitrii]MWA07126.1 matrixin family metalloprotease [Actinomadura physcomitrii]
MDDVSPAGRGRRTGVWCAAAATALSCTVTGGAATAATAAEPGRPPGWCKPDGALTARAMPQRIKLSECDLRGRVVRGENGLAATVPSDGTSVIAHSLRTDGASELRVEVDEAKGEITLAAAGTRSPQGRPREFRAPIDACQDDAYQQEPSKWPKGSAIEWHYYPGTAGLPMSGVSTGIAGMFGARTDCNAARTFTPPPDVSQRYAGRTATPPNLTAGGVCGDRDGTNVSGWEAMPGADADVLAATCTWFRGATTIENDTALQEHGKRWWPGPQDGSPCPAGSYDAAAVATHEAGHMLGLGHVEGSQHSALTMAPTVAACDDDPATLGKGDYAGLIALYGARSSA